MVTSLEWKQLNDVTKSLHPSTNPEILVKIGPLGSELPGIESKKNKFVHSCLSGVEVVQNQVVLNI